MADFISKDANSSYNQGPGGYHQPDIRHTCLLLRQWNTKLNSLTKNTVTGSTPRNKSSIQLSAEADGRYFQQYIISSFSAVQPLPKFQWNEGKLASYDNQ